MPDATSLYKYPPSETQAKYHNIPSSSVAMTIDPSSDQSYASVPVDSCQGTSLGQPSDYHDIHFPEFHNPDHNMEGSSASSPSTFSQWNPPSSMPPPNPAYHFPSLLDDDLVSWSDPHSPRLFSPEMQFNEHGTGFHPVSYSEGYSQDPLTSPDAQLSDGNYFDNPPSTSGVSDFPGINIIDEGSSSNADQLRVVGNLAEFPSLPSPFSHDAGAHFSRDLPAGAIPGSLAEPAPQEQLPLTGPYPTRGYPMHSYESGTSTEDPEYKKNPEAMRNSWIANYSQFVDGSKVFKIFSKHAKEKVATINTIKASAARRRNPAKFKCSIQGCGADFTRKHNLENHLKSHCGVTDRICGLCGKGFTTIPVWKRHQKSCEKAASSSKAATPKGFLDVVTAQIP